MTEYKIIALINRAAEEGVTELDLSEERLSKLPPEIGRLTNLTALDLSRNQITVIPPEIQCLTNLTALDFSRNQITVIPPEIQCLTNLTKLSLYSNQITVIPESIGRLTNLTELYLYSNQVTVIPESIGQLTNLTALFLSKNQIIAIPTTIRQLTNLASLFLSSNQITVIPADIGQLTNLTELFLANNQITVIPADIGQLTNLTELNLEQNRISDIPHALFELSSLTMLNLRNNPLPISPEILGSSQLGKETGTPDEIFSYLRQLHSGERRQLNEAKLLLIGQGSAGKTSLINRLIHNRYNPQEPQTDGLNVTTWPVGINTQEVRMNVWDFGGQEIYHATHQFFLTKRSLYILVCNCRTSEEENRIEYWLKLIQSFGGQSPVIIVGNKCDEQPLDINRRSLRENYPNIKQILETSCATSHGIEELRSAIAQEVAQLNDVYNLLPVTWFEVKEALECMDEDFITYTRYTRLCHEQNVTSEDCQEQLIDLLHNLGLVLNFREHPMLKDTNVLNPDWVTTGIYALLSDETLKIKNKGILTANDLSRILDADHYPAKRHPYFTKLMQEFQLCFPILTNRTNSQPKQFLIPGLLPKEELENTNLEGDTLEFQYHYRILPESVISRFIVLTHEDIHEQIYWRTGVMLHYKEGTEIYNIARIKADLEEKKIFITISGKATTRRSFLTILRKIFNTIHSSFANPDITEWVPVPGYPEAPPIEYQELLGLERMGKQTHSIGKLGTEINIRQLLDGYESPEIRELRRQGDINEEAILALAKQGLHISIYQEQFQGDHKPMTNNTNNLQGANVNNVANEVNDNARQQGNQHIHPANQQSLADAVRDIRALFAELDQNHDKTTPGGQMMIAAEAVKAIEGQPTMKKRIVNALKEGGAAAIESAVDHPATKPFVAAAKGFMDA